MTRYGVTAGGSFSGAPNPRRNELSVRSAPSPQYPAISLTRDTISDLLNREMPSRPCRRMRLRMKPARLRLAQDLLARHLRLEHHTVGVFVLAAPARLTHIDDVADVLTQLLDFLAQRLD